MREKSALRDEIMEARELACICEAAAEPERQHNVKRGGRRRNGYKAAILSALESWRRGYQAAIIDNAARHFSRPALIAPLFEPSKSSGNKQ